MMLSVGVPSCCTTYECGTCLAYTERFYNDKYFAGARITLTMQIKCSEILHIFTAVENGEIKESSLAINKRGAATQPFFVMQF